MYFFMILSPGFSEGLLVLQSLKNKGCWIVLYSAI